MHGASISKRELVLHSAHLVADVLVLVPGPFLYPSEDTNATSICQHLHLAVFWPSQDMLEKQAHDSSGSNLERRTDGCINTPAPLPLHWSHSDLCVSHWLPKFLTGTGLLLVIHKDDFGDNVPLSVFA
jgi:hypothetical protein